MASDNFRLVGPTLPATKRGLSGVRVVYPVQANAVFVQMPPACVEELHRRGWHFYTIAGGYRLMCSWDTEPEDVAAFVADLRAVSAGA